MVSTLEVPAMSTGGLKISYIAVTNESKKYMLGIGEVLGVPYKSFPHLKISTQCTDLVWPKGSTR
jgi:hypothetical protein